MLKTPKTTQYASLSLQDVVCLCAGASNDEAWEEFVGRVGKSLSVIIMRTAAMWGRPSRALVEDLTQVVYLKLWEGGRILLQQFALERPEAILAYLKKTAVNATHDHFRTRQSQSAGGDKAHVSTMDVDPVASREAQGSQEKIGFQIFLHQVDEHLKRCLSGPDQERDRLIFWLYFRQGMSTKEIASLPTIGLGAKGVGSVIERLKSSLRDQILGVQVPSHGEENVQKANFFANSY